MIDRLTLGQVPEKPHTVFKVNGELCFEECFTRQGFEGAYSILYHRNHPARARHWEPSNRGWRQPTQGPVDMLRRRHYPTSKAHAGGNMINGRVPLLFNADVTLLVCRPNTSDDVLFANGDGDELHFVHAGSGHVETMFGDLPFEDGDYVYIPRSTIHRWHVAEPLFLFTMEAHSHLDVPKNFRNASGQLRMDAPYSHRDFGRPKWNDSPLPTDRQVKELLVKKGGKFNRYLFEKPVLDIVGWDGFVYPFTFPIRKFQAKTGLVHLPPTIHTTFGGGGFVVCSFVPRVTDTHPDAIPCPYPHSSVDCDEVLFYVSGNFTSRKGVGPTSISMHPAGVVHGPHPGSYEGSIGSVRTDEMAVMVDTYLPLQPTRDAVEIEDQHYMASWA